MPIKKTGNIMTVDREQQMMLLKLLFDQYPWKTAFVAEKIHQLIKEDANRTIGNLLYLQKHGLIEPCIKIENFRELCEIADINNGSPVGTTKPYEMTDICPTLSAKGIDFLLGDKGLSSVFDVKTIRLEPNSAKLIVDYFVEQSDLSLAEKESFKNKIKSVPLSVLQEWLTKLLVEKIPYQQVLTAIVNSL